MVTTYLAQHPAFAGTYALLEELATAGGDHGLPRATRLLLSEALMEFTDSGLDMPHAAVAPWPLADAEQGLQAVEELVACLLRDTPDLATGLRLTRVGEIGRAHV